jgi:hypothetical protein
MYWKNNKVFDNSYILFASFSTPSPDASNLDEVTFLNKAIKHKWIEKNQENFWYTGKFMKLNNWHCKAFITFNNYYMCLCSCKIIIMFHQPFTDMYMYMPIVLSIIITFLWVKTEYI